MEKVKKKVGKCRQASVARRKGRVAAPEVRLGAMKLTYRTPLSKHASSDTDTKGPASQSDAGPCLIHGAEGEI